MSHNGQPGVELARKTLEDAIKHLDEGRLTLALAFTILAGTDLKALLPEGELERVAADIDHAMKHGRGQ